MGIQAQKEVDEGCCQINGPTLQHPGLPIPMGLPDAALACSALQNSLATQAKASQVLTAREKQ